MVPHDLSQTNLLSAIDGARIVYFDGRLYETALVVAQEVMQQAFLLMLTVILFCSKLVAMGLIYLSCEFPGSLIRNKCITVGYIVLLIVCTHLHILYWSTGN